MILTIHFQCEVNKWSLNVCFPWACSSVFHWAHSGLCEGVQTLNNVSQLEKFCAKAGAGEKWEETRSCAPCILPSLSLTCLPMKVKDSPLLLPDADIHGCFSPHFIPSHTGLWQLLWMRCVNEWNKIKRRHQSRLKLFTSALSMCWDHLSSFFLFFLTAYAVCV